MPDTERPKPSGSPATWSIGTPAPETVEKPSLWSRAHAARERWERWNTAYQRWEDTWLMAIVCFVAVALIAVPMPGWWTAAHNGGTWGTFTAVSESCERRLGCEWTGTFESDDGTVRLQDAYLEGDRALAPGDRARGQVVLGDHSVYADHSKAWLVFGIPGLACLAYLVWWVRVRRWRGPRREQRSRENQLA